MKLVQAKQKLEPVKEKKVEPIVSAPAAPKGNKVSNNYIQNLKKQFDEYEKKVQQAKNKIKELEAAFSLPENISNAPKISELTSFYDAEKKALVHLEKEMEAVMEELIELENK